MPDKIQVMIEGWQTVLVYLAACFAGGLGGAAVAANKQVQTRSLMAFSGIALTMLGVFSGLAVASYLLSGYQFFGFAPINSFHEILFWSLVGGFSGAIILGGANLSAGVVTLLIMKWLGLPFDLARAGGETDKGKK